MTAADPKILKLSIERAESHLVAAGMIPDGYYAVARGAAHYEPDGSRHPAPSEEAAIMNTLVALADRLRDVTSIEIYGPRGNFWGAPELLRTIEIKPVLTPAQHQAWLPDEAPADA